MDLNLNKALDVLTNKIEKWFIDFMASLPNLAVAVLVLTASWYASKVVRNIVLRVLNRFSYIGPAAHVLSGISQTCVFITGLFIALGIMNLDKTVSSLLAGAGVIGLALGFAFQEIASNFIAGILIAFRKPYRVGDILKINDYSGRVTDIELRTTRIMTFDGLEIIVPNKDMFTSILTNYTATPERRIELDVGVSYAENLREVRELVLDTLKGVTNQLPGREIEFFYTAFGDSSINFKVRLWITSSDPRSYLAAVSECVVLIKEAFDENGITIPFPIRTLDFGIKGGTALRTQISEGEFQTPALAQGSE